MSLSRTNKSPESAMRAALGVAISAGDFEETKRLIGEMSSTGLRENPLASAAKSGIRHAARNNDSALISSLFQKWRLVEPDLLSFKAEDWDIESALESAIENCTENERRDIVSLLLENGAKVTSKVMLSLCRTDTVYSLSEGLQLVLQDLLDHGWDVNMRVYGEHTPAIK